MLDASRPSVHMAAADFAFRERSNVLCQGFHELAKEDSTEEIEVDDGLPHVLRFRCEKPGCTSASMLSSCADDLAQLASWTS